MHPTSQVVSESMYNPYIEYTIVVGIFHISYIYIYNWEYNPFTKWDAPPSNNEIEWDLKGMLAWIRNQNCLVCGTLADWRLWDATFGVLNHGGGLLIAGKIIIFEWWIR